MAKKASKRKKARRKADPQFVCIKGITARFNREAAKKPSRYRTVAAALDAVRRIEKLAPCAYFDLGMIQIEPEVPIEVPEDIARWCVYQRHNGCDWGDISRRQTDTNNRLTRLAQGVVKTTVAHGRKLVKKSGIIESQYRLTPGVRLIVATWLNPKGKNRTLLSLR